MNSLSGLNRWTLVVVYIILSFVFIAEVTSAPIDSTAKQPQIFVLGIAQDGGYPQAGCRKACCKSAWENHKLRRFVSCLAIVDPLSQQRWIIDATPDFKEQLRLLDQLFPVSQKPGISGIFLTHGHMGHYTGLMHLGKEAMGTKDIPVYAMPRMQKFLSNNGPWDQLITLNNIALHAMNVDIPIILNDRIKITPIFVPHRDEYSETVGFFIQGPIRSALYISDIDKWDKWDNPVEDFISKADLAYLDGTFYDSNEIPNRDMSEIPHPFIIESMNRFQNFDTSEKSKIHFIHLNHTNPALNPNSAEWKYIEDSGYQVAAQGQSFEF